MAFLARSGDEFGLLRCGFLGRGVGRNRLGRSLGVARDRGMSTTEAAWLTAVARSGETEAAFIACLMPAAQRAAAGYDHLAESYAAPPGPDPAEVRDAKFADGLNVILDGLALRLPGSGRPGVRRAGRPGRSPTT